MSDDSALQVSRGNGVPRMSRARSISYNVRRIFILCFILLVAICLTAIWSLRIQSTEVNYLLLNVDPVADTNIDIFREMSMAQTEILQYQVSHDVKHLAKFYIVQTRVNLTLVKLNTGSTHFALNSDSASASRLLDLETIQHDAIERWLAYALLIEQAVSRGGTTPLSTEIQLFEGFRRANTELDNLLKTVRTDARTNVQTASNRGIAVIIAAALMTSVVMLVFGMRLTRKISKPIINLSDTMKRRHQGDKSARAKENYGSLETMTMAHEFNVLIESQNDLEQAQERALKMHELAAEIGHAVRSSSTIAHALELMCKALGEGLGVDRVMGNIFVSDQRQSLVAQWHLPDMPPLGNLPDELVAGLGEVASQLWQSSKCLVSNDPLAPEAQSERVRMFYRFTDATAVIAVPIGLAGQVIGIIYVATVNRSRQWVEPEVNAVQRVAEFLAHSIVEDTYRTQQSEHIKLLTRLDRQKADFVATVSHELRTPLTSISGYLELLKDGYSGTINDGQRQMLDAMDRNSSRLRALIENLLVLNRNESVGADTENVGVSIGELITKTCEEYFPLAQSRGITFEIELGSEEAIVNGARGQLQSAIGNIVSNAIKFSRPFGSVTIICVVDKEARMVRVSFQDRGIGIPATDQGNLFTRFFRAGNAIERHIPGTGLGLSIVELIIRDHGGHIRLASIEGEGTTVVIDLPLAPGD